MRSKSTTKKDPSVLNETTSQEPVYKDIYLRDVAPPHPGEVLRDDILPRTGLSKSALAKRLAITPQRLTSLLTEKTAVNADLAMRLGTLLGHGARYWLGLQMQYDIWLTQQPATFSIKPLEWKRAPKASNLKKPGALGYR
ncbi:MAG: HigA family addiction module antitoxin [Hyphomicrobiaceae bacterium]